MPYTRSIRCIRFHNANQFHSFFLWYILIAFQPNNLIANNSAISSLYIVSKWKLAVMISFNGWWENLVMSFSLDIPSKSREMEMEKHMYRQQYHLEYINRIYTLWTSQPCMLRTKIAWEQRGIWWWEYECFVIIWLLVKQLIIGWMMQKFQVQRKI